MRVLIGCEFSGVVRRAFRARGFEAWSCDLLPADDASPFHIQGSVLDILGEGWTLGIFHPPCTDLAVSGARHFAAKVADGRQARALDFVQCLLNAPVPHIALENPVSIISSRIRKPDCTFQPWEHGHGEVIHHRKVHPSRVLDRAVPAWRGSIPAVRLGRGFGLYGDRL